jgi:hypothetical protein
MTQAMTEERPVTFAETFDQDIIDLAATRRDRRAVHTNQAHEADWPCPDDSPRYLWLRRTHWKDLPLPEPATQLLYEEGHAQEPSIADQLRENGWELEQYRATLEWPQEQISGHIDRIGRPPARLAEKVGLDANRWYILELKGIEPNSWAKLKCLEDFWNARQPWLREYPGQTLLYAWMMADERIAGEIARFYGHELTNQSILIVKNKINRRLRAFLVDAEEHIGRVDAILNRCREVNRHLAEGTEPVVPGYDPDVCPRCSCYSVCMPGYRSEGAAPIINPETPARLERLAELEASYCEYKRLDEAMKDMAKTMKPDGGLLVAPGWEIEVKLSSRHCKATPEHDEEQRRVTFRRVGGTS